MSASKQNFFAAHWDWLAAAAGFAALAAAAALYAMSLGDSPEASADAEKRGNGVRFRFSL